jgi:DNA excision repair protein ERCC-6-like 2
LKGLGALLFDDGELSFRRLNPTFIDAGFSSLDPPEETHQEEDEITKTLNTLGVKYTHHNDHILQPSRIEEERALSAFRACITRSVREADVDFDVVLVFRHVGARPRKESLQSHRPSNGRQCVLTINSRLVLKHSEWRRKCRKTLLKMQYRLANRQEALVGLGYIKGPIYMPVFAQEL